MCWDVSHPHIRAEALTVLLYNVWRQGLHGLTWLALNNLQGGGGTGLQHWCLLKDTQERFFTSPVAHVPGNRNYKKTALTHQEISRILVLEFWLLEMWEIFCLPQHLVSGILSRQLEKTDVCGNSQRPTSFTALYLLREHRVRWGGARCHPATCAFEVSLGYIDF